MGTQPLTRPSTVPFRPSRMLAARLRRGFSVNALSEAMGLHRSTTYRHDAGQFAPSDDHLRSAARALRFPERFFLGDDIGELAPEAASFRSPSKLTARQRDMALGSAAVAIAFNGEVERLYALPQPDFPNLAHRNDPEQAADFVRRKWDLDEQPIASMMQLLESKGVRIFSLPADTAAAGAFSLWHHNLPVVLLDAAKPRDEQRFALAHELGHLLLHRRLPPAGPKAHQAASAFAAAFLMPAPAMRADVPKSPALDQVIGLAHKWGAPPAAVAQRLHKLGFLSDWQYRALRDDIAARDAAEHGAPDSRREDSLLLRRAFASLRGRGITKQKLPHTVYIYPKDVDELTFGLAMAGLDGAVEGDRALERLRPRLAVLASGA